MRPAEPGSVRPSADPRGFGGRIWAQISDLLLPQHCVVCGGFGASLHPACLPSLPRAEGSRCVRCWRPARTTWCERCAEEGADAPAFDALRAPFRFEGHARGAILEAKFRGVTSHLPVLAGAAAEAIPPEWRFDVVVPVPLSGSRRRTRGYNQAEILARHVARAHGAGLRTRLLVRTRNAPPQASLSAEERARNLAGVFAVRGVPPPSVLVVDDVTTTGATLSTTAAVLKDGLIYTRKGGVRYKKRLSVAPNWEYQRTSQATTASTGWNRSSQACRVPSSRKTIGKPTTADNQQFAYAA